MPSWIVSVSQVSLGLEFFKMAISKTFGVPPAYKRILGSNDNGFMILIRVSLGILPLALVCFNKDLRGVIRIQIADILLSYCWGLDKLLIPKLVF